MPAGPDESHLTTLFADVHYYFASPTQRPVHDRFNKASYLYLFHNASNGRAKLEVANNAGTPEQDAFSGYLKNVSVRYNYKQPTLFTFAIEETLQDQSQWHLVNHDLRHEQKYLYRLHTVDVYLWTEKDAATFLAHLKNVTPAAKLEIQGAPRPSSQTSAAAHALPEHRNSMSPVVQQLEKTAIGTHFPPRAESTVSVQSFPGPPTPATSGANTSSPPVSPPQAQAGGYNPAAPAAPEPITYRERTPPPPDAGQGTGLVKAAEYDAIPQFASVPTGYQPNSAQHTPQQAYYRGHPTQPPPPSFAGPPSFAASPPDSPQQLCAGRVPPPPPDNPSSQLQQQYAPSFATPPTSAPPVSPPPQQTTFNPRQSSYGSLPGQPQYASHPQQAQRTPSFGPMAASSPGLPPSTLGYQSMDPPTPSAPPAYSQGPGVPQQHQSQQQQTFGYSNYCYSAQQVAAPMNQYGAYTGDMHSQIYKPTEAEAAHGHGHGHATPPAKRTDSGGRTMGDRMQDVDKKVGGFLKRLEQYI